MGALEMAREARVISPGVLANSTPEELQRQVPSSLKWWRGIQTCSNQNSLSNDLATEGKQRGPIRVPKTP